MNVRTGLILIALALTVGSSAPAQVTPTRQAMRSQVASGPDTSEPTVSVNFPGGSAADYARAVQDASGEKRIVVMPGCEAFQMPAVNLQGVSLMGALLPLQYAKSGLPDKILQVQPAGDVFVITPDQQYITRPTSPEETRVFSLAEVLDSAQFKAADVLTAVQTALDMDAEGRALVKYHPETRLLIVRGQPDALDAVKNVLAGVMQSASAMKDNAKNSAALRGQIAELESEVQAAAELVEESQKYVDQVQEMVKQGVAGPSDLLKARQQVISARQQHAEMAGKLDVLRGRLGSAGNGANEPTDRAGGSDRSGDDAKAR